MLVKSLPCLVKTIPGDSQVHNRVLQRMATGDREVTDGEERDERQGNKREKN